MSKETNSLHMSCYFQLGPSDE